MEPARKLTGKVRPLGISVKFQSTPLAVGQIYENPENVRTRFDPSKMKALQESIERHGLILPVIVHPRPGKDGYELVDGHRRFRAITNLRWQFVDARIAARTLSMTEIVEVQRASDALHVAHSPFDLSRQCKRLQDELGSEEQAAAFMGLHPRTFASYVAAASLSPEVLERAEKRNVPFWVLADAVHGIARKATVKHVGINRDQIVSAIVEKHYAKALAGAGGRRTLYTNIGQSLRQVSQAEAQMWLKNPKRGPESLFAMVGESGTGAESAARSLYTKLGRVQRHFADLQGDVSQLDEKRMRQIGDRVNAIQDAYRRLRKRWNHQRGQGA